MLNVSPTSYKSAGMTVLMFFWGILLRKQEEKVGTLNTDDKRIAEKCWETPLLEEAFQFLDKIILQNISFQARNSLPNCAPTSLNLSGRYLFRRRTLTSPFFVYLA